mgnify:CR=1 FL=1
MILSDGRALDEEGNPYGEDVYSNYKIHIRVQWRANEELHVLGESGRDSGGERSVATMVYLISLQNINPAPFRVVDEINQAMDSSNERNVFQCITAACSQGGQGDVLSSSLLSIENKRADSQALGTSTCPGGGGGGGAATAAAVIFALLFAASSTAAFYFYRKAELGGRAKTAQAAISNAQAGSEAISWRT